MTKTGVRVLVGTRKGAFILTSDVKREKWDVAGPHFAGFEMYHLKGSPVEPNRIYASQCSGWFGQLIQRSDDAGVEDSALFKTVDGGKSWQELSGLRGHGSGSKWQPGAGGLGLHTIILDPNNPARIFIAISAAGAFRSDDEGVTWKAINQGLRPNTSPIQTPKWAIVSTASPCIRLDPALCLCRNTGTSCAATTPENPGTKSAATCPLTLALSSTFTHTSQRRSM